MHLGEPATGRLRSSGGLAAWSAPGVLSWGCAADLSAALGTSFMSSSLGHPRPPGSIEGTDWTRHRAAPGPRLPRLPKPADWPAGHQAPVASQPPSPLQRGSPDRLSSELL